MIKYLMWSKGEIVKILIIIAITRIYINGAKKSQKLLLYTSSKVSFNTEYLEDHSLTIGPNNQTLDVILNIVQDLNSDPWVQIIIKSLKGSTYRTIFQYDINVCHIFGKQGAVNFVSAWMNNFLKYGDMPKSCPVKKGKYSWFNLKAEKLNLPNFLPNGKYQITTNIYLRHGSERDFISKVILDVEYK